MVLSDEARPAYVPGEMIATYRELVRLHSNLADEVGRYCNEIHALLFVLFPEFTQVFADPCRPTALGLLKLYPGAIAFATIDIEELSRKLVELSNGHYRAKTAQKLLELAKNSASSVTSNTARAKGLVILCDQLLHTQANLDELESELDALLRRRLRRLLYMVSLVSLRLKGSAFGDYYRKLRERGLNGRSALMAVMRKLLVTAYSLLKNGGSYDPQKVWVGAALANEKGNSLQTAPLAS